ERALCRQRRRRRQLGAARVADRDVQAQQRQSSSMADRRAHQARQQLAQQPARRTHALGLEHGQTRLTAKPKNKGTQAPLTICMTEPDAGTDVANYKTNVDRVGNSLRLNGVKTLISRAEEAGMFVVFTRIDKKPGRDGIGCVLVEKGTPGFSVTGTYHTMGGENLHEIRFEDCELPPENLVLEDGFRKLLSAFNTQRCLNPSISLGLAEGALEEAVKYARERQAFGQPIADFQGMR